MIKFIKINFIIYRKDYNINEKKGKKRKKVELKEMK